MGKYYFGPMNTAQGHNPYTHIGVIKTSNPEADGIPIIRYLFGPYKTKKEAIQNSRYQFSIIAKFYFVNCNYPSYLKYDN